MYLWIGCKLPSDFERDLRCHCLRLNETIGLNTQPFSLPQHISLKISFDAGDQYEQILDWLTTVLEKEKPFSVQLLPPKRMKNILWLPVKNHPRLFALHDMLDRELLQRFGISQHPYDKEFKFHSTLFMEDSEKEIIRMESALTGLVLPDTLKIDTFLLGVSLDGKTDIQIAREIGIS